MAVEPRRAGRLSAMAVVVAAAMFPVIPAARANQGVAVDLGAIVVRQALAPGGHYKLPTLGVTNPGTDPSSYRLGIGYLDRQSERMPPEAWFVFEPRAFDLRPHETRAVSIELNIPVHARPGTYAGLLRAALWRQTGGVAAGAAAAARLTFRVKPSSDWRARLRSVGGYLSEHEPTSYLLPSVAVLVALGWILRRRFRLSISVGRRR